MRNLIQSSVICEEINFLASEIKSLPRRDKEVRLEPNQVGGEKKEEKKKAAVIVGTLKAAMTSERVQKRGSNSPR